MSGETKTGYVVEDALLTYFCRFQTGTTKQRHNVAKNRKEFLMMAEQKFNLSERAEALDLELRRDDDGCYWLDFASDPTMQSVGPLDLDEVEDWITAAERGLTTSQREEFCAARRWRRIHPELYADGETAEDEK